MKQETSIVARNYRLQVWAFMVQDCNNRPQGMTVKQWCLEHDITPANYYYRMKEVRKACLLKTGSRALSLFPQNYLSRKKKYPSVPPEWNCL